MGNTAIKYRENKDDDGIEAKQCLERDTCLFVGAQYVPETEPMLIDGLLRERGVSVFFGAFDEFKTTLVLDMMVHVAYGLPWQGRKVRPRPVVWYALEGEDELPKRVQALEASMRNGKGSAWGHGHAPLIVRERIPKTGEEWRREIAKINLLLNEHVGARKQLDMFEQKRQNGFRRLPDGSEIPDMEPVYPGFIPNEGYDAPIIVIDTLSLALGDEDEKGPKAAGFITDCLDLLKDRPDLASPEFPDDDFCGTELERWYRENGDLEYAVASHVIIIHHQTKTGIDFAGHRAIAANSQALYRVHRFGKITDPERPFAGQLTPIRVKGIARPAPVRFDVNVTPVEGTEQTTVILKDKAKVIPKKLKPIIEALCKLEDHKEIGIGDVNACIDEVTDNRTTRNRHRKELEVAGVLEPVEGEDGKLAFYRFHDTGAV